MCELCGTKILRIEVRFCRAVIDDKQGGTGAATDFRFHLARRPDALGSSKPEVGELFHIPRAFQRLFHVHRKTASEIQPALYLCVLGLVFLAPAYSSTGRNCAPRTSFLPDPSCPAKVKRVYEVFVAESLSQRALGPLFKGQHSRHRVARMRNLYRVLFSPGRISSNT